jgi:hypothetical protein
MSRIQQKQLEGLRKKIQGPFISHRRELTDEVMRLLANPGTPWKQLSLNCDSEGMNIFWGDEQQPNDHEGEWTLKTAKKTAKPLPKRVIEGLAAEHMKKQASSSSSSSSSSRNSSSSASNSSSSRKSSSSSSNSWNIGPDDSSKISGLSVDNSKSYNKQYPDGVNGIGFAVKQSQKDKKELEKKNEIQREIERVENGEEDPEPV